MKKHIIIDFSNFENDELDEKGGVIEDQLTDNLADFPALPVPLATYVGYLSDFNTVLNSAIYPERTVELHIKRKLVESDLRKNGVYVNELADGDEMLLAKSGYPFAKDPAPVGELPKASFKDIVSIPGGFLIELNHIEHAKGYLVCTPS